MGAGLSGASIPESVKERVAVRIAGEVVLAKNPGARLRRWRQLFNVKIVELARKLGVSSSVICDYEKGRTKSPGTQFVRRYIEGLLEIDEERGGRVVKEIARLSGIIIEAILDIREFASGVPVRKVVEAVDGEVFSCEHRLDDLIYGYTVIDSIQAIKTLSGSEFFQLFGMTAERALVFTGVTRGRSPMIAIRLTPLKPRCAILHGAVRKPDPLAVELAEIEQIPLIVSHVPDRETLIERLRRLAGEAISSTPH